MQVTQAQLQHICNAISLFVQRCIKQAAQSNTATYALDDAQYALKCLEKLHKSKNFTQFVQNIVAQDTDPREATFALICNSEGEQLGLTYNVVNAM